MTISEQPPFCSRPFEWFEIHPDGSVFLCCPAWLKRSIGNLLQQSVDEIWNGPVAQEIRKSIFNGSFHNCRRTRCPHLTDLRAPVCRAERIDDARLKETLKNTRSHLPYLPSQLNLCFDYSCNLACPSCREQILQAKGKELVQAEEISRIILTELLPSARSITLSGFGDPFGSPTYLALLKRLNRHDYPLLQQVRLHSNGQLLTEATWDSLPELHPLISEIEISVDAGSETTYQLNRPGGSFCQLQTNLTFLAGSAAKLTLSMVVQQNNWREIPQLLCLAQSAGTALYLSQLVNWGTFRREDFLQRAVHRPEHPEHHDLKRLLRTIKENSGVKLGNLAFMAADEECL